MRRAILLVSVAACLCNLVSLAQASGFANYFARVSATGGVSKSSGVATVERTGVGVYDVRFNRLVNYCGYVATVTGDTPGYATINLSPGKILTVSTYATNGGKANRAFNVMVMCAP